MLPLVFVCSSRAKPLGGCTLVSVSQKHFSVKRISCLSCKNQGKAIVKIMRMIHAVHVSMIIKRLPSYGRILHLDYIAT